MKKIFNLIVFCTLVFITNSLHAQKIFIRALGTAGETATLFHGGSAVRGHENEIEATGYSQTDSSCGFVATGGGGGTCKTATGPWVFSMNINPSVTDFKSYMYRGRFVGRISIDFVTSGATPFTYYTVLMNNVYIKTVSESGSNTGVPQFYIELDPTTIKWTYIQQNQDGSSGKETSFGWDRAKNIQL